MQLDVHETTLCAVPDLRHALDGPEQLAALEQQQLPVLLRHQQRPVREERHAPQLRRRLAHTFQHETMTRGFELRRCGFVEHQREPIVLTWLLAEHETFQVEDSAASDTVATELIAAAQLAVQANSMPVEGLPSARGDSVLFRQVELRLGNAVACQDRESTGFVGALRVGKLDAAHASQIDVGITQGATLTEVADVG